MKTKMLEVRDYATFIPVLCIEMQSDNDSEEWLLSQAGFSTDIRYIELVWISCGDASYDPFSWGDRTMKTAHMFIRQHWNEIESGDVIDVQFILGESSERKESERFS